jgi:DNA-binding PadR family transcriptional regulator
VRRKPGSLVELEAQILAALVDQGTADGDELHGFGLARVMADRSGSKRLTGHGTLYKALARLEQAGAVSSRWEDSRLAAEEGRPRRRLYRVTGVGRSVLRAHRAASAPPSTKPIPASRVGFELP